MPTPPFFVPAATDENRDEVYADLAAMCSRPVPDEARRIYSITYTHDGSTWTATVGEELHGTYTRQRRSRGLAVERTTRRRDPARVLAIFEGNPYIVVTDARPLGSTASEWANPFIAGQPRTVRLFPSAVSPNEEEVHESI
jgi:hypothetical protein